MARKSAKLLQAQGALVNLHSVAEFAAEALTLGEQHGDNKVFIYHAHDVQRWVNAALAGGLEIPASILRYRTFWAGR